MGTRFLAKGISALMLAVAFSAVSIGWAVVQGAGYVPGRVLVMFQPGVVELPLGSEEASIEDVTISSDSLQILTERFGVEGLEKVFKGSSPGDTLALSLEGELVKVDDLSQVYKLFLPDTSNIPLIAQTLSNLPGVVYAEPDYIGHLQSNDPYFSQQWGLEQDNDWDIDAPQAWELTTGSNNVLIALLDSGEPAVVERVVWVCCGQVTGDIEDVAPAEGLRRRSAQLHLLDRAFPGYLRAQHRQVYTALAPRFCPQVLGSELFEAQAS